MEVSTSQTVAAGYVDKAADAGLLSGLWGRSTTPPAIRVDRITDAPAFHALREEWTELLRSSDANCLFLSWEWAATWWKHLGAGGRLLVFAVRHRSELVALAPFRVRAAEPFLGRPFPVLEFLGSGFVGSDYLDVIVRRGYEEEAANALAKDWRDCRRGRRPAIRWNNTLKDGSFAALLADRLKRQGWSLDQTQTNVCPYIPLSGYTWDSYLGSLGAEHRSDFKRKWKRLNRDFDVRFEQAENVEECAESIDLLIEQHNLRWRHRGGSDAFHRRELVAFHREVTQVALRNGWLRLFVLRLDGKPAASLYGFVYGGKFYFYQSGFDIAYERYSVGMIAMGLAIRKAIEEGADEYDLLHGEESYKSHWSRDRRDLVRLEMYPPGFRGLFYRGFMRIARASRGAVRSVMGAS